MTKLSRAEFEAHARHWIAAWNAHDVDAVLSVFAEDVLFVSPLAASVTGNPVVAGRDALRDYWIEALSRVPDLKFELSDVAIDVEQQSVTIFYISRAGGRVRHACEHMRFRDRLQVFGEAFFGRDA